MDNIYYNTNFLKKEQLNISIDNRAFKYGDSFFETIKCISGNPIFWEDHYFRMAASFGVLKMNPPDHFDIDNFQSIIKNLLQKNKLYNCSARVRVSFFRTSGGYYLPNCRDVNFIIESEKLIQNKYYLNEHGLHVSIYKENIIPKNILSNIKTNNKLLNTMASIYVKENAYDDCLLINSDNNIVEAISGNIFIIKDGLIYTPPLLDGCLDGIMRKIICKEMRNYVQEKSISFSHLLNADEVLITNVISGIKWVYKINKKIYKKHMSQDIIDLINRKYLI
mgnify:CR=1 FL=1